MIDEMQLYNWLNSAKPNDKIVYFVGSNTNGVGNTRIGRLVYSVSCMGKVYLMQKKLGYNLYEYICVRSSDLLPDSKLYKRLVPIANQILPNSIEEIIFNKQAA